MKWKIALAIVAAVVGFAGVSWHLKHQRAEAAEREKTQARKARAEADILGYIDDLKVAPEAIHMSHAVSSQLCRTHRSTFQLNNAHWFYPYGNQKKASGSSTTVSIEEASQIPEYFLSRHDETIYSRLLRTRQYDISTACETYMWRQAIDTCSAFANILRKDGSDIHREYLDVNPELWSSEIRPRLLLLADAAFDMLALHACDALVAGGDRSAELRKRLTELVFLIDYRREEAVKLLRECDWPVPEPRPTSPDMVASITTAPTPSPASDETTLPPGAIRRIANLGSQDDKAPSVLRIGSDGAAIVAACGEGAEPGKTLWRVDLNSRQTERIIVAETYRVSAAAVSPDGKTLVTYGRCRPRQPDEREGKPELVVWDLSSGQKTSTLPLQSENLRWMEFTPDGSNLLLQDSALSIYDIERQQLIWRMPVSLRARPIFVTRDRLKAMGLTDRDNLDELRQPTFIGIDQSRLRIWAAAADMRPRDFNRLASVQAVAVGRHAPEIVAFTRGPMQLMTWTINRLAGGTLGFNWYEGSLISTQWNETRRLGLVWRSLGKGPVRALFSPDDRWLITMQRAEDSLIVWTRDGRPIGRITGHQAPVRDMRFAGDRLVTTSDDGSILVWDWPALRTMCEKRLAATATREQ